MRRLPLIISFLFLAFLANAQTFTLDTYTPENGLSDATVQKIFQDSRGLLFMLTRDGFSVYDGQRMQSFTEYKHQPLSVTTDIVEISKGRFMISSITGIFYYSKNGLEKDTTLSAFIREPGYLLKGNNGKLFIQSNNGLHVSTGNTYHVFGGNKKDAGINPDKVFLQDNRLLGFSYSAQGQPAQLVIYSLQDERALHSWTLPDHADMASYEGRIFARLNQQWFELNMADLTAGKWNPFLNPAQAFLPAGFITDHFYINNTGKYWFSSERQGICSINPATGVTESYNSNNGLIEHVTGFFTDAENNQWLMIPGKGVQKIVQSGFRVNSPPRLQHVNAGEYGSVLMRNGDSSWLHEKNMMRLITRKNQPGMVTDFFWNGQRWTLFAEGYIQSESGKVIRYYPEQKTDRQVSEKISFDKNNNLLLTGNILALITTSEQVSYIPLTYFTDNVVTDDEGRYWCFARNGDIASFRLQEGKLLPGPVFHDATYSARVARHWNKDTFCVGTRTAGIQFVKMNAAGYRRLGQVSQIHGLSNNFITELIPLPPHELLTGTAAGLDMVHLFRQDTIAEKESGRINIFSGVQSMAMAADSSVVVVNDFGQAFRYTITGASRFNYKPEPFFSSLMADGEWADPETAHTFPYNRNNIRLSVSAPSFVDEKNILFLFRVEGAATKIEQRGKQPDIELNNLEPGHYTVNVTVYFPGYSYTTGTLQYVFTIRKPFWKTWIFRIGLFLLALSAAYLLFRYILQRRLMKEKMELEKEKAVAQERTRIARDMHDDLGAGISTIKFLSEGAAYIPKEKQPENNRKISSQADALVDKMNDIIWAMNEANDTLDNLLLYTKAWVAEFASEHGLEAKFTFPEELPVLVIRGEMRRNIFLCVKESVHNIIKHAAATWMQVDVRIEKNKLQITISDNGKGFDPDKIKSGNGLPNMKKRIESMRGTWRVTRTDVTSISMGIPV